MISRNCTSVRKGDAIKVAGYLELAKKIAELQFENRDHVLMLRGQSSDYRNKQRNTTIKPSIFRGRPNNPNGQELSNRFEILSLAEQELVRVYNQANLPRKREIERRKILRWSILQHYEVCDTPLLDVSQSLRIAASFASDHDGDGGFVFALGVPNISGAITTSMESEMQVIRLASVCHPQAHRPHIQEGYLLGEYPDIGAYSQKQLYPEHEVDFGKRLIAKFRFIKNELWNDSNFPPIPHPALYPDHGDELKVVCDRVKQSIEA
jgi:hypothetical protein